MEFLSDKKLRGLTTERLNELRKKVLKAKASAIHNAEESCSEGDNQRAKTLSDYYEQIKDIMSDREHIENASSPKKKSRSRETIRRM